jgi:hypothetical protein
VKRAGNAVVDGRENGVADGDAAVIIDKRGVMAASIEWGNDARVEAVRDGKSELRDLILGEGRRERNLSDKGVDRRYINKQPAVATDGCKMGPQFGEGAPEGRGTASAEDKANWNDKEFLENVGEDDREVGMIEHATEGSFYVVAVLEEIGGRIGDAQVPNVLNVALESRSIVDGGAFVLRAFDAGFWYGVVGGAAVGDVHPRGAVNAQAALALPDGPGNRRDEQTIDEHRQETWEHDVIGLAFFINEFFSDGSLVWVDCFVVVIQDPRADVGRVAAEVANEGGPFRVNTESLIEIDPRVAIGGGFVLDTCDGIIDLLEVAVCVGILAAQVPNDVTMTEVERDVEHAKTYAAFPEAESCIGGMIAREPKDTEGCASDPRAEDSVGTPTVPEDETKLAAVRWRQPRPGEVAEPGRGYDVMRGGPTDVGLSEATGAATMYASTGAGAKRGGAVDVEGLPVGPEGGEGCGTRDVEERCYEAGNGSERNMVDEGGR